MKVLTSYIYIIISCFTFSHAQIFSNPVSIMPVGNSITYDTRSIDERPDGIKVSYRSTLWDSLRSNNYSFNFVGTQSTGYDVFPDHEHEGHPGWRDDQVAANIYGWLQANPNTDIILLHVGTNALDSSRADVQNILNQIDQFENNFGKQIWVILATIINRVPYSSLTTTFNNNIASMAQQRIANGDKIILVDMENGAGLNYSVSTTFPYTGDMFDNLHPNPSGYKKMADQWFNTLKQLLPAPSPFPPTFVSTPLTIAFAGQEYAYDADASGVGAPNYFLASGPSGMIINQNTGRISWTPATTGSYSATIEAVNSSGSDFQNFNISVEQAVCPPDVTAYWKLDETTGTTYADELITNDAFAGSTAPTPVTGQVGGAQQFNGSTTQINVPANPAFDFAANESFSIEFWYKGSTAPSTVEAAVARNVTTTGAKWWVGLNANDGRARFYMSAGGKSAAINGSIITDGNWHHVAATKNGINGAMRIYVDGVLQSSTTKTFTVDFSSPTNSLNIGWFSFQSAYSLNGSLDEVAIHKVELSSADILSHYNNGLNGLGYCGSDDAEIAPIITSTPVISVEAGQQYSYDVNATGNPSPNYSLIDSPEGMNINSITGLIQWTTGIPGNYNVTVEASNGINPPDEQSFVLSVIGTAPVITSTAITSASVGQAYSYDVESTGNPAPSYSLTVFPTGMTINTNTGVIDWTPTSPGDNNVTVQASNGVNPPATQSFVISVTGPEAPVITSTPVTTATVNQSYTYDVNATGNPSPTYSLTEFPIGMTINSQSGVISWTPSSAGSFDVTVQADNGVNPPNQQAFTIQVDEAALCPPQMTAYWQLDESTGTTYVDEIGINDAFAGSTSPTPVTGQVGGAQQFNGSTTQINVPANPAFDFAANESFSVEFWYKGSTAPSTVEAAVARNLPNSIRWWVGLNAIDGRARFYMTGGGRSFGINGSVITDGSWHHIVATRNGTNGIARIYVDGVMQSSTTKVFTVDFSSATTPLNIGWFSFQSAYALNGSLDEIAIHKIELSSTDILSHYNNGLSGSGYCGQSSLAKTIKTKQSAFDDIGILSDADHIKLQWTTTIDANEFFIERNTMGKWENVGTIKVLTDNIHYEYNDLSAKPAGQYSYRIKLSAKNGGYEYSDILEVSVLPKNFMLYQNYPNPFNPVTRIKFSTPSNRKIKIKVYTQLGEEVATLTDQEYEPGTYELQFNGSNLASGVYFYKMESEDFSSVKKFLLVK